MMPSLVSTSLLDPQSLITGAGAWGLAVVCLAIFAETGLLIGFFLPGDTLLFFTGVLTVSGAIRQPLWIIIILVGVSAALGDQLGYFIGRKSGPAIFERRESGVFSRASVIRTQGFFDRFGPVAVTVARFVPVVRTFAPVAAGVGHMSRRLFTLFNLAGAAIWSGVMIGLGFGLAQVPGVSGFVSQYIDVVLVGIVVLSIAPIIGKTLALRRRKATASPEAE